MAEAQARTCPQCGAELPAGAPEQPCPACLMKLGLESWAAGKAGPEALGPTVPSPGGSPGRFEPPAVDELQGLIPNLEILELIGSGGMGAVYKARQTHLDRIVALKIINPTVAGDPGFAERFAREAKVLARLNHPHIVTVHDFGRTDAPLSPEARGAGGEGPLYYFIMEYVDGTNLRELIRAGKLQPEEALAIVPQICDALQYAHDQGVVHRDIKPENILIDRQGRVKIADFGLARIAGQPPAGEAAAVGKEWTLTATGQVMGTLHYMAPEQMKGSHTVDHRADIYSLGVVFYEMLTGELPIGRFEPPSKKVQIDVRLDEVVLRALENQPERRYQKASDVKTDVETISTSGHPKTTTPSKPLPWYFFTGSGGLKQYACAMVSALLLFYCFKVGLNLEVSLAQYLGVVAAVFLSIFLAWAVRSTQKAAKSPGWSVAKVAHMMSGFALLLSGFGLWVIAAPWLTAQDRQAGFWFAFFAGPTTFFFILGNLTPHRPRNVAGLEMKSPSAPDHPGPVQPTGSKEFFDFWMTRQPGFARWVGVPMLIALVLWIAALVIEMLPGTTLLPVEQPEGLWLIIGFCGLPVLFMVLTLVWVVHGRRPGDTQRTAAVGRLVLLGAVALSFLIVAAFRPDISGAVWTVVMGLTAVAFVVDAIRYRGQRRAQAAMFAVLAGLAAVAICLVVRPQPFLQWLYQITGDETPGRHDATFLRAIAGLMSCWLIWQSVQEGRRVGNFTVVALVGAGMILLLTMIALMRMSGQATTPSVGPNVGQPAMGTIREMPLSEAERNTPGLSIYRYELDLPPGDWWCEVWTELWKDDQRSRGPIHLGSPHNPKRLELQWRQGESLSPEAQGKVRWDFRAAMTPGGSISSGGWIDDPFAETPGRTSTWRGTDEWPFVPGQERTLLILRGHRASSVPIPSIADPNELARRIEQENAHADVELYLKLRLTPAQPAPSGADQDK